MLLLISLTRQCFTLLIGNGFMGLFELAIIIVADLMKPTFYSGSYAIKVLLKRKQNI
jgi:hypothetical protein